jgi:hypothetical protein
MRNYSCHAKTQKLVGKISFIKTIKEKDLPKR